MAQRATASPARVNSPRSRRSPGSSLSWETTMSGPELTKWRPALKAQASGCCETRRRLCTLAIPASGCWAWRTLATRLASTAAPSATLVLRGRVLGRGCPHCWRRYPLMSPGCSRCTTLTSRRCFRTRGSIWRYAAIRTGGRSVCPSSVGQWCPPALGRSTRADSSEGPPRWSMSTGA